MGDVPVRTDKERGSFVRCRITEVKIIRKYY